MKHLSALDALFLQLETADTPMHVGSLTILEPPARRRGKDGAYRAIREHIATRLHIAPVFQRRLAFMPLDLANPLWIDAEDIDLDYHVRRLKLPAPGTRVQLETAVAKLHEGMLDRSRPLWQFTVIEGLRDGEIGFYAKIHHAALDGQGGVAVASALLDLERVPRTVSRKGPEFHARNAPSALRMLGAALRNAVSQYKEIVKAVPKAVKAAGYVAAAPGVKIPRGVSRGPDTPLNVAIGPARSFVTASIALAEAKAIATHFGVKLNDVVLATCAGALRRQFAGERAILGKEMIGAVPASLRAPGDTAAENQVTMMLVGLATHIADPAKRLAAIARASARAKGFTGSVKGVIPTDLPSLGIPWLMAAATPLLRKAVSAGKMPVIANLVISNVPGPQAVLYLAGMQMQAYYPVSIVTHGLALNVTILSYHGSLDYGLVAGRKAVPNLRAFARHLQAAHKELLGLSRKK